MHKQNHEKWIALLWFKFFSRIYVNVRVVYRNVNKKKKNKKMKKVIKYKFKI